MQFNVFKIEIIYEKINTPKCEASRQILFRTDSATPKGGLSQCIPVTFKYPLTIPHVFFT
jgi:hypothetical protein